MKRRKETYWWLSVLSIAVFVAVWWLCCDVLKLTNSSTLPGPITIAETFIKKLTSTAPDGATLPLGDGYCHRHAPWYLHGMV